MGDSEVAHGGDAGWGDAGGFCAAVDEGAFDGAGGGGGDGVAA